MYNWAPGEMLYAMECNGDLLTKKGKMMRFILRYLDGDDITLEDLRNAICHSFVTVEEDNGDGSVHGNTLILDDRVIYHNRKTHAGLGAHSSAYRIPIDYTHKRLTELFGEVLRR